MELKKEIKKLQRLRDQIKGWITSSEIKDKTVLWNNRKLVEVQMEKFKLIEKEMKTKAYSREGLSSTKLEQKDKDKLAAFQWLNSCIEKLSTQVETMEAETENLLIAPPKKGDSNAKIDQLEKHISMHRLHIEKLEVVLRMIQNESLSVERANKIRDDVEYYCDYYQEPDFLENEHLYDELELDNSSAIESNDDESDSESVGKGQPTVPAASTLQQPSAPVNPVSQIPLNGFTKKAPQSRTVVNENPPPVPIAAKSVQQKQFASSGSTGTQGSMTVGNSGLTGLPKTVNHTSGNGKTITMSSVPLATILSKNVESKQENDGLVPPARTAPIESPWVNPKLTETLLKGKQQPTVVDDAKREEIPPLEKLSLKEVSPGDLEMHTVPYSFARLKSLQASSGSHSLDKLISCIDSASLCIPDIYQFDRYYIIYALISQFRNKPYAPTFPLTQHPPSYPTNPPSIFENPAIFEKFDVDTLFFIFYFQPKTVQQYLAAKELKKHSWRFHKKYLTWFQRFEEPKIVNDDFEQGTYIYFDYEGSWCQRKKAEFTFEYRYLEDVELP